MRITLITITILAIYLGNCASYTVYFAPHTNKTSLRMNCSAINVDYRFDNLVRLRVSKDDQVFYHHDYKSEPGILKLIINSK